MTPEELKETERLVNEAVFASYAISAEEMPIDAAREMVAHLAAAFRIEGGFIQKYRDFVPCLCRAGNFVVCNERNDFCVPQRNAPAA